MSTEPKPMLELVDVHKSYWTGDIEFPVLKGVNLKIMTGELVSIMGPSGSGKSTLLNILGLLDTYDSGGYYLEGQLIKSQSEADAARLRNRLIGFVFQSFNLLADRTAEENVALPLYHQGISRRERHRIASEYLAKFGMDSFANRLPNQLSGGQKQRVAIARALVTKPKLILADEPTGALDTQNSHDVIEILKEVNRSGMTVIVITHENEVAEATQRIIRIRDGVIATN